MHKNVKSGQEIYTSEGDKIIERVVSIQNDYTTVIIDGIPFDVWYNYSSMAYGPYWSVIVNDQYMGDKIREWALSGQDVLTKMDELSQLSAY